MFTPHFRRSARLVTTGALWGFLAGALAVSAVVWRSEPSDTWLAANTRALGERFGVVDKTDDDHSPVLEAADTVGTSGAVPSASISAPPAKELADRDLEMPVEGIGPERLVRSFDDARGARKHEAIDILAPKGTPVKAVEDGRIARLFYSRAGGITIYQLDPTERYCYYYAHLDRYADGLDENDRVRRGQVIGFVGTSGNAPKGTAHLHFAIFRLTDTRRWWEGVPLDPYDILH